MPPFDTAPPSREQLALLLPYQSAVNRTAAWQVASTATLYLLLVASQYAAARWSVLPTLLLSVPTAGLIVRIFMLQHDCGHDSLFDTSRINRMVGAACSLVTLTPFAYWRRLHARHHSSWNNLDRRGIPADFYSDCLTLAEYEALGRTRRLLYRLGHHAALIHLMLPPIIFTVLYRVPFDTPAAFAAERRSVYRLDLALVVLFGTLCAIFGWRTVLLVHLPAIALSAIVGIWLFSVQHRFEDAQWTGDHDWNRSRASLDGVSHLALSPVLRWFSASIGVHHVHHLRPGIPNYRLQACHLGCPSLTGDVATLTLSDAFRAPSYTLWDEATRRMVPFPTRAARTA